MLNCMSMQASIFKQYKLFIILGITLGLTATVLVTYANTSELGEPIDNEVIETIVTDTEEVNPAEPTLLENQEEVVEPEEVTESALPNPDESADEATPEETTLTPEVVDTPTDPENTTAVAEESIESAMEEETPTDPETTLNPESTEPVQEGILTPASEISAPTTVSDTPDLENTPEAEDVISSETDFQLPITVEDTELLPLHPRECIQMFEQGRLFHYPECLQLLSL
jgi:hypothetical protein